MAVPLCALLTLLLHTGKTDSSKYLSYAHRVNERNKDSSVPVKGVVPPLEKTAGETSRDDPKSSRSSPPRENDMESLDIKDQNKASSVPVIGGVRKQLTVQENTGKYALENDIKGPSGHVPVRVYNLSPTNLEHLSCKPGQKAMFVLHPWKKETYVGCYEDKLILDYCVML